LRAVAARGTGALRAVVAGWAEVARRAGARGEFAWSGGGGAFDGLPGGFLDVRGFRSGRFGLWVSRLWIFCEGLFLELLLINIGRRRWWRWFYLAEQP
jgi:hypothetical protein